MIPKSFFLLGFLKKWVDSFLQFISYILVDLGLSENLYSSYVDSRRGQDQA